MVAVVNPSKSLRNALHYNEHKVTRNEARLIHSANYAKDTDQLGISDKIKTIQKLQELNQRTTVNTLHISLNFPPGENLSEEQLRKITDSYMDKLGFGQQPYLVYQHHDSSHPHVHIVTTNIQADGKRIKLHNIGRNQSEKARKAVEQEFNLTRADKSQRLQQFELKPINAQKVLYGKSPEAGTKRAITNVLDFVLPTYKYTSLPELNAVLKNYNVLAHQGSKESRTYRNNGLYYQVLNDKGQPVGVPIPASRIYNKPTIARLQESFIKNEELRSRHKLRVKNAVDLTLAKKPGISMQQLQDQLKAEKIQLVLRQNPQGTIYGITYIDHHTRCVFNGSDLGKEYSANKLQQRIQAPSIMPKQSATQQSSPLPIPRHQEQQQFSQSSQSHTPLPAMSSPTQSDHHSPEGALSANLREEARKKRKRKKLKH